MNVAYVLAGLSGGTVYLKTRPKRRYPLNGFEWTRHIGDAVQLTARDALGVVERFRGFGGIMASAYAAWVAYDGTHTLIRLEDLPPTTDQIAEAERRMRDARARVVDLVGITDAHGDDDTAEPEVESARAELKQRHGEWISLLKARDAKGGAS